MDIYKIVVLCLVFLVLKASSQNDSNFEDTAGATTLSTVSFISPITNLTALTKTTTPASTKSSETATADHKEEYEKTLSGLELSSELPTSEEDSSEKITSYAKESSESARSDRDNDQVSQNDEEELSESTKSIEEESSVLTKANVEISSENTTVYPSKASEINREMEEPSNKTISQREEYTEIASLDEEESSASLEDSSAETISSQEQSTKITASLEESSKEIIPNQEKSSEKSGTLEKSYEVTASSLEKSSEITESLEDSSDETISSQEKSSEITATFEESSEVTASSQDKSSEITASLEESSNVTASSKEKSSEKTESLEDSFEVTIASQEQSSKKTASLEESSKVTIPNQEKSSEKTGTLEKSYEVTASSLEKSSEITESLEDSSEETITSQEKSSEITATLEESSEVTASSQDKSSEITASLEESSKVTASSKEKSSEKTESLEDSFEVTRASQEQSSEITAPIEESSEVTISSQENSSEITATSKKPSFKVTTPSQEISSEITAVMEESYKVTTPSQNESSENPTSDQEGSNESGSTTSNRLSSENIVSEESFEVTSSSLEKSSESEESSKETSKITTSNLEVIETTTPKQEELLSLTTTSLLPTEPTEKARQTETTTMSSSTETSTPNNSGMKELSTDGIYVQVLGKSGKFVIGQTKNPQNDPNNLMVTFDSIQEKDGSGNNVGTSGRFKHSFNNFAGQKFDISKLTDDKYQNLAVKRLDCTAYLDTVGARLTVQIFLFREEGSVNQGDEVSRVSKGTLKFNIMVEDWKFCGSDGMECRKGKQIEFGEFIDFALSIKGSKPPNNRINKRTNAQEFDMGGNASVVLFKQAKYDESSAYENLPQGFPKIIQKGSRQLFVFRFRKFSTSVFYDPLLNIDANVSAAENKSSTTVPLTVRPLNANITTVPLSEETLESNSFTSTSTPPPTKSTSSLLTYAPSISVPSSTSAIPPLQTTTQWTSIPTLVTSASSLQTITHTQTSLTRTITTLNKTAPPPTSVTTEGIISTQSLTTLVSTTPLDDYSMENTKDLSTDGIYVRVLKKSGKFVMGRTQNPQNDPNKLMVTFDSIQEKDNSGNNVGTSGRFKHSFNNFAGQKFAISQLTDDRYQSLAVKRLDCTTYLDTVGASLTVQIFLFREKGTVSQGDEVSHVSKGTLKFNIIIENWKFCGSNGEECRKGKQLEYGEFIDFTMSIKGSMVASKKDKSKRTSAKEFYLGGNSSVVLSEKVKYDDGSAYENLPQGFPQLIQRGSRQSFLFRFRKFDRTVFYDPQLNVDGSTETDETTTSTTDTENNPFASSNLAPVPAEISTGTAFLSAEGLTVKIHGQSGKMTIGYSEDPDQDSNKVQVTFDAIGEIATDGTEIGQTGQQTHTFNTFANLDFSFSQIIDDRYMNLSSKRVDFSANFPSTGARLVVQVFVFTQAGEISIDGERTVVTAGTVKFNILVESWGFCGYNGVTCTKGNVEQRGEAIDFTISVKGKGDQQVRTRGKRTDGEEFDLGGQASLLLSRKIQRDGGAYESMPSGYPLLSGRGSKTVFILRFPGSTAPFSMTH